MKNLLAVIVLGSISLGTFADEEARQPVYQDIEIDVITLNSNLKATLEMEREEYRLALEIEQNERMDLLFGDL